MTFTDEFPAIPGPLRSVDPIFIKMNSMKVEEIYKFQVAKFVFKCLNQTTPVQFHNWYKLNHLLHVHHTRSNYNISNKAVINNLCPISSTTDYGLKQRSVVLGSGMNYPISLRTLPLLTYF